MKIGKLTWKLVFGCIYCTVTKHHKTISLTTAHSVNMLGNKKCKTFERHVLYYIDTVFKNIPNDFPQKLD